MKSFSTRAAIGSLGLAAAAAVLWTAGTTATANTTVTTGNTTCAELGHDYGFRPNAGGAESTPGTFNVLNGVVVTWSYMNNSTSTIAWSANFEASAVIVGGGGTANAYHYDPSKLSGKGLTTPMKTDGTHPSVSHVEFCFDYNLMVSKTADTSFTRTYTWGIDKTGSETNLSTGQVHPVDYTVTTTRTHADSDFTVSGTITIKNPWPVPATQLRVTDWLPGAVIDCGGAETVPANGTVHCTYSVAVADATAGTNKAITWAYFGEERRGANGRAPYSFGSAPTLEVDECITVTDSLQGSLGQTCAPKTYTYTRDVGPYTVPGVYTVTNVASFLTHDTGTTGSDDHTVTINVPKAGCTLTQGYWKTHSAAGPAPYDDNWRAIGAAEHNTLFFGSGQTWLQVFGNSPAGNAYYILAHQYMAAELNVLNGASAPTAVQDALTASRTLFSSVTGTSLTKAQESEAKSLADVLTSFNEGGSGPGHCSE